MSLLADNLTGCHLPVWLQWTLRWCVLVLWCRVVVSASVEKELTPTTSSRQPWTISFDFCMQADWIFPSTWDDPAIFLARSQCRDPFVVPQTFRLGPHNFENGTLWADWACSPIAGQGSQARTEELRKAGAVPIAASCVPLCSRVMTAWTSKLFYITSSLKHLHDHFELMCFPNCFSRGLKHWCCMCMYFVLQEGYAGYAVSHLCMAVQQEPFRCSSALWRRCHRFG